MPVQIPITQQVEATRFTLQVATDAAVSTSGAGNARDAHVTLYYGSVQVPGRITRPSSE